MSAYLVVPQALYAGEAVLVFAVCILALLWPAGRVAPLGWFDAAVVWFNRGAVRQALLVAGLAIGLRAALLPVLGPPPPIITDEFSLLLEGQTLALGRLANPTHLLYPFFETLYVSQLPGYASMYFPGRGAHLALGILLTGNAWMGVWLSMVLLALATLWMLRAWVSREMALLGAILVVIRFGVLSGWINSYYGPEVTALGGVLVLGAFPRLMEAERWRDALALGVGLLLLMTTRPFEGLFFSAPFLVVGGWKLTALLRGRNVGAAVRLALPTVLLVGLGAAVMLAYDAATTGHLLLDPYTLNRQNYGYWPPFLFSHPNPPHLHGLPPQLEYYYAHEDKDFELHKQLTGFILYSAEKLKKFLNFYVGPVFVIPLVIGFVRGYKYKILLASVVTLAISFMVNTWPWSQYLAPGFGVFWIYFMLGFEGIRNWTLRGRPSGLVVSRLLPVVAAISLMAPVVGLYEGDQTWEFEPFNHPCCAILKDTARSKIIRQLEAEPGRDLVIYRAALAPKYPYLTVVANEAEIDKSEVVFAYDRGPDNQRLLDYYPDRKVWLVSGVDTDRAIRVTDRAQVLQPLPDYSAYSSPPPLTNPGT